jgi:hypothetical protein
MPLHCSLCAKSFASCKTYLTHLRLQHALHYVGSDVKCGQESCPRSFQNFRYFKSHLEKHHSHLFSEAAEYCHLNSPTEEEMPCEDMDTVDLGPNIINDSVIDLTASFMNLVGQLQCKANISHANIQTLVENMTGFMEDVAQLCVVKVKTLLSLVGVSPDVSAAQTCMNEITLLPDFLAPIASKYKRDKYWKESGYFIEPVQKTLATRNETRYVASTGCHVAAVVEDTMQYIPLELLLGTILLDPSCTQAIKLQASRNLAHCGEKVDSFSASKLYRNHPFFLKHPDGLALNLYIDGFETTNVLGSHTGIHKMEGLYACIQNFPAEYNSRLDSIFLVALWYAHDVKTYGYGEILKHVVESLQQLESDTGVVVNVRGHEVTVHACMVLFSADNLGFNSLFGFTESFTATRYCRFCETTKDEACYCFKESELRLRTKSSHNQAVQLLNNPNYDVMTTGIKKDCPFNALRYWHVTENFVVDAMHDILEGIAPFELSLVLNALAKDKSVGLTVDQLNSALTYFDYSLADKNSRPPTITSFDAIRMSASEMWCLLRNITFLIGHHVPREQEHWLLLLKLLEICDIVFAPSVTEGLCNYLGHLVEEHHVQLAELLGTDKRLLPKHHFLVHYAMCMRNSGPPVRYWSMRFEGRHQVFKDLAKSTNCYKNLCKTLADRFQMALAVKFLYQKFDSYGKTVGPTRQVNVNSLGDLMAQFISSQLSMCAQDHVFVADWITVGHYPFKPNAVTVNDMIDGIPQFGIIVHIINVEKKFFFIQELLETIHFDAHFNAYAVKHMATKRLGCVDLDLLKDHVPYQMHTVSYEQSRHMFVRLRYCLF